MIKGYIFHCFGNYIVSLTLFVPYFFVDPSDNLREILQNVAKLQGVSNMRKLGHLNNFTKVRNLVTVTMLSFISASNNCFRKMVVEWCSMIMSSSSNEIAKLFETTWISTILQSLIKYVDCCDNEPCWRSICILQYLMYMKQLWMCFQKKNVRHVGGSV